VSESDGSIVPPQEETAAAIVPLEGLVVRKAAERARAEATGLRARSGELKFDVMGCRPECADGTYARPEVQHLRLELRNAQHARRLAEDALGRCLDELSRLRAELDESRSQRAIFAEQLTAVSRLNEEIRAELAATDAELQEMNKELQGMADQPPEGWL